MSMFSRAVGARRFLPRVRRRAASALLLTALCASPAGAQPTPPDLGANLGAMLDFARERNPELQWMRMEADAAAQRALAAGALPDPMLQVELRDVTGEMGGGGFNVLPARVVSTRYQIRQSFPAWGSRDARRGAAQAASEASARRADASWAELAMRIKTTYARYRQASESLAQSRALLDLIERLEAVAHARYAGGLAAQQDVIRAQVERTAMTSDIALLESELAANRARLNGLLARPADAPLAAPAGDESLPSLARLDAADLRQRVLARNPSLAAEDARLRAAEHDKDAVFANRHPEFTLGVAPVQTRNRIREWELMFEISIPLQQDRRRAEEREALSMIAAARARREAVLTETLAALGANLAALASAHRVETLTHASLVPQAELTLQAALAGYETGKVDFATVLDAQRQIRQARLMLIRTRAEGRMRLAEIERLLGDDL